MLFVYDCMRESLAVYSIHSAYLTLTKSKCMLDLKWKHVTTLHDEWDIGFVLSSDVDLSGVFVFRGERNGEI